MLARLFYLLPFELTVPEGAQFTVYQYEIDGYRARYYPPGRSDRQLGTEAADKLMIDNNPAFQADVLRIDFQRDSFDLREDASLDPPEPVIVNAINFFLVRLRHVAKAAQIRPISSLLGTWRIQYVNDDETTIEEKTGYVRERGTIQYSFSWVLLDKNIWNDIHNLPTDYEPPPWEGLLLDAAAVMPHLGAAVVLSATALEVFISRMLDQLASTVGVPAGLWEWINNRRDRSNEPTVEEQYDVLLKFFTGHSLKENLDLWEAFKNLKAARNSFAHEGVVMIGGAEVSEEKTKKLISSASAVIAQVKEWLPPELHWPEFKHQISLRIVKRLS